MLVVVMGVSGSGKSTVARPLAHRLGTALLDADDVHTEEARAQMSRGVPLTDEQRDAWMERVVAAVCARAPVVLACSALRKRHRDRLRSVPDAHLFLLDVPLDELEHRVEDRPAHFFDPTLLEDQLATLERPTPDEAVTVLDGTLAPGELVDEIARLLA